MGRDINRQTAKFSFNGHKIRLYKPTEGQYAGLAISDVKNGVIKDAKPIVRLFKVLESLVVDPKNWDAMDEALLTGAVELTDFMNLVKDVFEFDWTDAKLKGDTAEKLGLVKEDV